MYLDDAVEYEDNDLLDDLANAILDRQEKVIFSFHKLNLLYLIYFLEEYGVSHTEQRSGKLIEKLQ